jgi:Zn finger protein HypA/HybF involved in hydrogenase expression
VRERGVLEGLLADVAEAALACGGGRIVTVAVRIGALSPVRADDLLDGWSAARRGTAAAAADLIVRTCDELDAPDAQDLLVEWIDVEATGQS